MGKKNYKPIEEKILIKNVKNDGNKALSSVLD